jgi:NAD(P)H-hydrate epimerase
MSTLSREQVRELDRRAIQEFGVPGIVLMENAGRGTAEQICALGARGPVVICCGPGNNGGDGFVIARHLDLRKIAVRVLVWGEPGQGTGEAATNYRILERSGIPLVAMSSSTDVARDVARNLADADWVVDALLGTGARGEPRSPIAAAIDAINASGRPVLAVDLPSGLDCESGQPAVHTIRAAHTCTFVAPKPGFFVPGAAAFTGQLHVVDIGAPRKLLEEMGNKRRADESMK